MANAKPPRTVKKQHLPIKLCARCQRPMTWRRRWARVWEEVKYCSEKCRRDRGSARLPTRYGDKETSLGSRANQMLDDADGKAQ
jgi:hypothetical protein